MGLEQEIKLLTASDVADLCEVDLKTIHNWVERGCIPHFRTPGRHLRFRAVDVANFLREWGYAIPRRFYAEIAQMIVIVGGANATGAVTKAIGQTVAVRHEPDVVAALLRIGAEPTSALVIDASVVNEDAELVDRAISAIGRNFDKIPVIILGNEEASLPKLTAMYIPHEESAVLRAALIRDSSQEGMGVRAPRDLGAAVDHSLGRRRVQLESIKSVP